MANKFFVAGGVDNDWATSGNWSTLSGGSGGAGQPSSTDTAILDGNSPSTCNITTNEVCQDFNTTGWTGTIDFNSGDHYLQIYGDITISSTTTWNATGGTGIGYMWWYDDTAGGLVNIASTNINCSIRIGGGNSSVSTWTIEQSFTFTGPQLWFAPSTHTSYDFVCNQTGASVVTWNPTAGDCYFGGGSSGAGYGEFLGNADWKITGTVNFRFTNSSDSYRIAQKFEVATGGAVTIFGASGGNVCRMGGQFEMHVSGTGTIVGDPVTTPVPIFYHVGGSETATSVAFNDNFHYRIYMRQSSSTQYWQDYSTGTGATEVVCDLMKVYIDGSKVWYSWNGKLRVAIYEETSSTLNTTYFRGDSGFIFNTMTLQSASSETKSFRWGYNASDAARFEFKDQMQAYYSANAYGNWDWIGEDASLKSRWYIWHNCRWSIQPVSDFTKIDALSEGQACTFHGLSGTTTDSSSVHESTNGNLAVLYDDGSAIQQHTYYKNEIYDPVTVSGTVELSATPQANARVHVVTGQVDGDGNEWFMLRHVEVTDGSGNWSCTVPRNSTVYVSAHYDSGATKYNSLSKPYISAT